MKIITFIFLASLSIGISYLNRTQAFSGPILKNTEEFWNGHDQSAILRFCHWKGYSDVAFVKSENKSLKTIVCANK